jgi:hypothetical protein
MTLSRDSTEGHIELLETKVASLTNQVKSLTEKCNKQVRLSSVHRIENNSIE